MYQKYAPFTSADIDFLGDRETVLECAGIWDGTAKLPEPFDVSPNSGLVIVSSRSEDSLVIDFLSSVYGIDNTELLRERVRVCYKNTVFFVTHPIHCLKSRVSNVTGLHRDDSHSLNRLMLAVEVMNRRIKHLLDRDQSRQALKEIEAVFSISRDTMTGIPLFVGYGIDIFGAVPDDSRLGELFVKRRYPQMKEILDRKRKKF